MIWCIFSTKTPFPLADGEALPMSHNTNAHDEKSCLVNENMPPVRPFDNGKCNIIIDPDYRQLKW